MSITVVGSLNMDLVLQAPRIPAPGETILGANDLVTASGGKGANQAYAAARLGAQVNMIGRVGEDAFGPQLLESLQSVGVNVSAVRKQADAPTGVAVIVVDATGENSIVVSPGANGQLTPADISANKTLIEASDMLLLQLETPLETVLYAAHVASDAGVTVLLNPAPVQPLPDDLLRLVDVLVVNETEAEMLSGQQVETNADAEKAIVRLSTMSERDVQVVLTRGGRGVSLSEQGVTHAPAFPVSVVDTTAAGDAFVGALAVALAEGKPFSAAVRFANAAGALATTRLGAQPSLPAIDEVQALLASR